MLVQAKACLCVIRVIGIAAKFHIRGWKREKRNSQHKLSHRWIALVKRFLMASPCLQNHCFSFLDASNEKQIWKSTPDTFHMSTCLPVRLGDMCEQSLMAAHSFHRAHSHKSSPRALASPRCRMPPWAEGWVIHLSQHCLKTYCLQPADVFPSHTFPGCCLTAFQDSLVSEKMHLGVISGNLYLLSCFHMIYTVFSAPFSWCLINLGYKPL